MPVLFQKVYKREDARRNPDVLYVFGDNVRRIGRGGQAGEMRDEPNAVGVATKYAPGLAVEDHFGEEAAQVIAQKRIIDNDMKPLFEHVKQGGIVVWPTDGIGTGLSALPTYSPSTFAHIEQKLAALIRVAKLFDHGEETRAALAASAHLGATD
jgi:hypothetical protein